MNWYLAKIVFNIVSGEGKHTPQFDEQLRLIHASGKKEAYSKAFEIGLQEEDSFLNDKKQTVQWRFVNVSELKKLPQFENGTEIYSRIRETSSAQKYTDMINRRAEEIQASFSQPEPQYQ